MSTHTSTDDTAASAGVSHDEWLLDESIEETFPASDAASSVQPGSTVGLRHATHGGGSKA